MRYRVLNITQLEQEIIDGVPFYVDRSSLQLVFTQFTYFRKRASETRPDNLVVLVNLTRTPAFTGK